MEQNFQIPLTKKKLYLYKQIKATTATASTISLIFLQNIFTFGKCNKCLTAKKQKIKEI